MLEQKIVRIEWARLQGQRPREAGCNSRLAIHGLYVRPGIAVITTDQGGAGFGWSRISQSEAESLIGTPIADLYDAEGEGEPKYVPDVYRAIEYPVWDLVGQLTGKPVYALVGDYQGDGYTAPCYDTSLYIDDLHLTDHQEAADLIAAEAQEGINRGHTTFKIKIGRGAMHMPLESGMQRDVMVIKAVRQTVGTEATILLDANNGYNLNLTKTVLTETAEDQIYWMEEAFHEDGQLYRNLKDWMAKHGIETLIADGEGGASANLLTWAEDGLIDVIQYDIFGYGFSRWLKLGQKLDTWGVHTAPHHYGGYYGNFATCHLKNGIQNFGFVEWDAAVVPGIDDSSYTIQDGQVQVPNRPGFGLTLDRQVYDSAIKADGFIAKG